MLLHHAVVQSLNILKMKNIKPGDGGTIKVRFDTANKPGKQMKTVTLTTNTNSGKKIIRINGFVLNK